MTTGRKLTGETRVDARLSEEQLFPATRLQLENMCCTAGIKQVKLGKRSYKKNKQNKCITIISSTW